jgi:hypothetical protein
MKSFLKAFLLIFLLPFSAMASSAVSSGGSPGGSPGDFPKTIDCGDFLQQHVQLPMIFSAVDQAVMKFMPPAGEDQEVIDMPMTKLPEQSSPERTAMFVSLFMGGGEMEYSDAELMALEVGQAIKLQFSWDIEGDKGSHELSCTRTE